MMLDHGFWYDLDTLEQKHLLRLNFAVSMGPPSHWPQRGESSLHAPLLPDPTSAPSTTPPCRASSAPFWTTSSPAASPKYLPSVVALKDSLVKSTLELFQRIKSAKELLPTPQKSHYLFSMRDISRVFQSLSKATFRTFKNDEDMVRLWVHECTRVVMDRLVSPNDQAVFNCIIKAHRQKQLQVRPD
jgi:dynein heavy chain